MQQLTLIFILKLTSLLGATLNTVGFLTFFFWESLVQYRWQMIIGGIVLIGSSELLSYWLIKRHQKT